MSTVGMNLPRAGTARSLRNARRPLFYTLTAAFLGLLLLALSEPMRFVALAWTAEYGFPTHRVHHVMIGALLTLLAASVAVQLYRPAKRVGAYLLAAITVGTLTVVAAVTGGLAAVSELLVFVVPLVIIGLLHPGLRSFRPGRETVDVRMLALAGGAAVALLAFAAIQLNLQLTAADEHAAFEHYQMMAGGTLTIAAGALLAAFRPVGWRFLAAGVAALAAVVGIASVAFPAAEQGITFGIAGGVLAVLWAVAFLAVAEYGARSGEPSVTDSPETTT